MMAPTMGWPSSKARTFNEVRVAYVAASEGTGTVAASPPTARARAVRLDAKRVHYPFLLMRGGR